MLEPYDHLHKMSGDDAHRSLSRPPMSIPPQHRRQEDTGMDVVQSTRHKPPVHHADLV